MMHLFHEVSEQCSRRTTERYSTSFSSAIRLLHSDLRQPIYNIYGFVRFADEIVDSFHDYKKEVLLAEFKADTYAAIQNKISLNPILHSFQLTVNKYKIDLELVEAFFRSMEMDLDRTVYNKQGYEEYIYGSAEVVGLMCLYVFLNGDKESYEALKPYAQALGAAFQKVNFLRDVKADYTQLDRTYFPEIDFNRFTDQQKREIEADIQKDFEKAYLGIKMLPNKAKFGVYVAFKYYYSLFRKIKRMQPARILNERVRIPNYHKIIILFRAGVRTQLNFF
jgi:phytoene/squalene synthetase